ncbi:MAG TPA: hypothetical protein VFK05_26035 [Polyangiaceae bacterium]|nr:hypothetical protein [Polyangiaceae bacterium]
MMTNGRALVSVAVLLAAASGCGSDGNGSQSSASAGAAGKASAGETQQVAGSTSSDAGSGGAGDVGGAGGTPVSAAGAHTSGAAGSAQGGTSPAGGSGGTAFPAGGAGPSTSAQRQTPHPIGGANTAPNGFYEYLPPGYDGSAPTPLLVFWHGLGQDGNGGSELDKVPAFGPPALISKNKWDDTRPFIVLSPQHVPTNGEIAPGAGCPSSAEIDAFVTWALANYKVDPKQVFLTGLSCGAIGSWDYLGDHKGSVVAAAVLIAGNPGVPSAQNSSWSRAGCDLGSAAIWSIHGDADDTVPYAPDHDTMQNLIACSAPPRRAATFTQIKGGGHNVWDATYDLTGGSGDIYAWLLANAKP